MKKISTGWFKLGAAIAIIAACYWYPIVWQVAGSVLIVLVCVKLWQPPTPEEEKIERDRQRNMQNW